MKPPDESPPIKISYSIEDLAKLWGVSKLTIRRELRDGAIAYFRVRGQIRVRVENVLAYEKQQHEKAAEENGFSLKNIFNGDQV